MGCSVEMKNGGLLDECLLLFLKLRILQDMSQIVPICFENLVYYRSGFSRLDNYLLEIKAINVQLDRLLNYWSDHKEKGIQKMACSFHNDYRIKEIEKMKRTGIAFMIIGNLLHVCSGLKMKIKETTSEKDDPEMNIETEREITCPPWLGISFIVAGGMMYLAGLSR